MDSHTIQPDSTEGKKRILIVEDNIESQLIFKVYLRKKYSIEIAGTAEEGIGLLKNDNFDLILLDINLPGKLNGIDVLNEVRIGMKLKDMPIIVITAYALKGDKEKFLSIGANDYLAKPVMKDILLNQIERYLN